MPGSPDDFYSGFEGEPEIRFSWTRGDGSIAVVRLWIGHFDAIMNLVQPNGGVYTGLADPYHRHGGWYEGEWPIPSLGDVIEQWGALDTGSLDPRTRVVHARILEFLEEAMLQQKQVWIAYD